MITSAVGRGATAAEALRTGAAVIDIGNCRRSALRVAPFMLLVGGATRSHPAEVVRS